MSGVAWSSCQKDDTVNPSGNIMWTVQVKHHTQIVSDARVWIKSGGSQFPGQDTGIYEYGLDCDVLGEVSFTELLPGEYYLYCEGNDGVDDVIGALGQILADSICPSTDEKGSTDHTISSNSVVSICVGPTYPFQV